MASREHTTARTDAHASPRIAQLLRRCVAGVCAVGLLVGTVLPMTNAIDAASSTSARAEQSIVLENRSGDADLVVPDAVAPVEELPRTVADGPEGWTRGLPDTALRSPFDAELQPTDSFGYRTAPVAGFHDAQDLASPAGTPIRIVGDGVVSEAGFASDGCGFALSVEHRVAGQWVTSRYCHMQENSHAYRVGDRVSAGDLAGTVGSTGLAFGAHLHLVIRREGEAIDPLPFIAQHAASTAPAGSTATPGRTGATSSPTASTAPAAAAS